MTDTTTADRTTLLRQIDAALRLQGSTLSRWSTEFGIDPSFVRRALRGQARGESARHIVTTLGAELKLDLSPLLPAATAASKRKRAPADRQATAARLQEEALRLQLSSEQMADIGGVGRTLQHFIEMGTRPANTDYLQPLAEIGLDVNYLLTGKRSGSAQHNAAKRGRA